MKKTLLLLGVEKYFLQFTEGVFEKELLRNSSVSLYGCALATKG